MPLKRDILSCGRRRAIGKKRARQPIVRTRNDLFGSRIITAVQIKNVIRICRRTERRRRRKSRILIPNRAHNNKCVNLDAFGVRRRNQIRERVKACSLPLIHI